MTRSGTDCTDCFWGYPTVWRDEEYLQSKEQRTVRVNKRDIIPKCVIKVSNKLAQHDRYVYKAYNSIVSTLEAESAITCNSDFGWDAHATGETTKINGKVLLHIMSNQQTTCQVQSHWLQWTYTKFYVYVHVHSPDLVTHLKQRLGTQLVLCIPVHLSWPIDIQLMEWKKW